MSGTRFFKFVLLCLTIAAFIYLMYVLFLKIKAAAATISFMPIIITSAVVTCSVICTAVVLGLAICFAIYLMKPSKVIEGEQGEQKVTLNNVILSDEIKEELRMICNDISQEKKVMFEKVGFKPPQGYLLYGPPGNGKTLLARAVAGEANISFESISASELVGEYVGQGVYHVRNFFKRAKKNAPCIIFIDEIDSIGAKRNSIGHHVSENCAKTLNQLLTEMDGFNFNKGVIVIAATNRREVLDEALLRPGRFSKHIYISLPELGSREKILDLYMKNVQVGSDLNLKEIAEKTEGYSGAELSNLVNEAKHNAVRRTQEQKIEEPVVSMGDFTKALEEFNSTHKKFKNEKASNTGNNVINALLQPFVENYMQQFLPVHNTDSYCSEKQFFKFVIISLKFTTLCQQ